MNTYWHRPPLRTRLWNILRYKWHDFHHGVEPQEGRYASEMREPQSRMYQEPALFLFLTRRGLALAALLAVLCVVGYRVIGSQERFRDHLPTVSHRVSYAQFDTLHVHSVQQAADETTFVTGVVTRSFK